MQSMKKMHEHLSEKAGSQDQKKKMRKKSEEKTLEQINASEVYTAGAK